MAEWVNDEVRFWKRATLFVSIGLAAAVLSICALLAVFSIKSAQHHLELNAVRSQLEKERDIAIKMWQVTDPNLNRLPQRPALRGEPIPIPR